MSQRKRSKTVSPRERELIVEYLSYALDDVHALSETGLHLLQMAIATINKEAGPGDRGRPFQSPLSH